MDLNDYNREFFYGGHAVGLLHDVDRDHPGDWHYHPYRGPGHYDMATDLIAGKQAECYFDQGNERTRFTVVSRPHYGVLKVISVSTERHFQDS